MSFKSQFEEDIKVFLNDAEFADEIVFKEAGFTKRVAALYNEFQSETDASIALYFSLEKKLVGNITKKSTIIHNGTTYGVISWADNSGILDVLVQKV